ncbi:unnamed protein product [Thelazia callipaeda]|uniref:Serine/threonine-protein kinase n=1 Tax=Thelazia callipaeda TaxID=103827 RepID=A0A158RD47_THECL|nr:unnamed protein product [Thelazia callipaeda]
MVLKLCYATKLCHDLVNDTVSELCDNIDPQNPQNLSAYRSATLLVREDKSFKYPQGFGNLEANTQSIEKKVTVELCDVNCASADCLSCNTTDVNSQAVLKRKRLSLLAKYCDPDVTLTNSCNNTVIQKDISLLKQDAASSNSKSPAEYDGNNQIGLICTSTSACNSIGCQSSSDETKKSCKDECKKQSIVTQRTIIYPENGLEPCFANSIYCFKYENVNNVEVEDMKVANSVADQKKEQIDADKAVSVLNIMLQRHLANGNQNGSFIQTKEPVNGSYSVLSEDKITKLDSVDSAKDSLLNANRCDLPSSCTDYFSVSSERKTEVAMDYKTECAAQEPNENFDRYSSEKNVKSTPLKWCSDRSTVRYSQQAFFSDRMPRGQTRRLALLFETMSDAACTEMLREYDNLKRRGKSVPPAFTNKNYQRKYDLGTQQYDREFTMEPTNHPSDFNRARTYQHSIFGEHLEDSRSNMEVRNVRNIESRLESSLNGSPSISRNIYVDGKQQKLANQEKYLHIDTKDSKPIPDGDSDKSILKNYYGAPTNYDLYKNAKQPSRQSNKWFGYIDHENSSSPSQNSMCGNASYIGVWDHQQYELGLLKGVTNLKRYDSRSNKALDEVQARFRRIDHSIERHPEFHSKIVGDRFQRGYGEDIGREVMDNVAEVEKAFDFVNKV